MGRLWWSGVVVAGGGGTCRRKGEARSPTAHSTDTWNSSRSERKVMASGELREEKTGGS